MEQPNKLICFVERILISYEINRNVVFSSFLKIARNLLITQTKSLKIKTFLFKTLHPVRGTYGQSSECHLPLSTILNWHPSKKVQTKGEILLSGLKSLIVGSGPSVPKRVNWPSKPIIITFNGPPQGRTVWSIIYSRPCASAQSNYFSWKNPLFNH